MNEIRSIFENNMNRVLSKKGYIFLTITFLSISIALAIFFTVKFEMQANVAYVGKMDSYVSIQGINLVQVNKMPAMSEFVTKKYDAVITPVGNGELEVKTIRGSEFKKELEKTIQKNNNIPFQSKRKIGTAILGYTCMFILISTVMFMSFYAEEREKGMFTRIVSSKIYIANYLLGHIIFTFFMLYIPTILVLIIEKNMFKVDIGFSYLQYSFLIGLLILFGISFSLFMSTVVNKIDNAVSISSSIIVLTSILSGVFFTVKEKGTIFDWIVSLFPQKQYLLFAESIENGNRFVNSVGHLLYILVIIAVFFALSIWLNRKKVILGKI
ncbi:MULTISPECIES: ABC transporter permease [Bacillus cereus group]|uniref:ABC transporter permease n=1 Tax=Bacillus cereus group TaxID=86661 RepID=UPI00094519C3|nr:MULTISPECIES: ABC transporter permease [Bacillus cereus group]MCU5066814.1 ABC transporter permease [Bacillus pacificus]MCU5373211.1 ABC transporter permease [Bacillus pacificus]MDA1944808.1 ABC transporter permease [Bacillus cereus group sp. BcHK124]